jgi:cytochrome c-type biogenesis protein CcmH/NrfG
MESKTKQVNGLKADGPVVRVVDGVEYVVVSPVYDQTRREEKEGEERKLPRQFIPSGSDWNGRTGRRPQPKLRSEDPAHPAYWYALGRRLEADERHVEARRAYAKALELKPGHREALARMAFMRRESPG